MGNIKRCATNFTDEVIARVLVTLRIWVKRYATNFTDEVIARVLVTLPFRIRTEHMGNYKGNPTHATFDAIRNLPIANAPLQ